MSNNIVSDSNENINVESGIITPNLFKGKLGIPTSINAIIPEEENFAHAILEILASDNLKTRLKTNQKKLLEKFNLESVSNKYLLKNN